MTPTPPVPPAPPIGLLLARGPRPEVDGWVRRSVLPVTVVALTGWTVVVPRGPARVGAPYDDAALLLAARPLPLRGAPGLGFAEVGGRAVITVHPTGRRRPLRWVVWEPEVGVLRPPGLDLAGPADLVSAAGCRPEGRDELVGLLQQTRAQPRQLLLSVMAALGLPGTRLLVEPGHADGLPGAVRHEPDTRQVGWFEDAVRDTVRLRRELGALT